MDATDYYLKDLRASHTELCIIENASPVLAVPRSQEDHIMDKALKKWEAKKVKGLKREVEVVNKTKAARSDDKVFNLREQDAHPDPVQSQLVQETQNMNVRSGQVKNVMYISTMFCKCSPSTQDARLACERLLSITGGELDTWGPQSGHKWQELCILAFGKHHPRPLSTLASTADTSYTTMQALYKYGFLSDGSMRLLNDILVLKRLVSICMAYDCELNFVSQDTNGE